MTQEISVRVDEFLQGVRAATLGIAVVAFLQLVVLQTEPSLPLGASYLFAASIPTLALAHGLHYVRTKLELDTPALRNYLLAANILGFGAFLTALGGLTLAYGKPTFYLFTAVNVMTIWIFGAFIYQASRQNRAERRAKKRLD